MEITKELIDKEIELTRMRLEAIGSTNPDFIFGILALLSTLGLSFIKNLFGYWIPAMMIIILFLGILWLVYLLKSRLVISHLNTKKSTNKLFIKTSSIYEKIMIELYSASISEWFVEKLVLSLWTITVITLLLSYMISSGMITLEKTPQPITPRILFAALLGFSIASPLVIKMMKEVFEKIFDLESIEVVEPGENKLFKALLQFGSVLLLLLSLLKSSKDLFKMLISTILLFIFLVITTIVFPLWFLIVYFKSLWDTFTMADILTLIGVTLLLGLVILSELSYLTKHDIRTELMNSLARLVNLRQALVFAEESNINIETLGINLEQEYFEAIKRAEFRLVRFLRGTTAIYVPNVNYSYILWICKKERKRNNELD